MHDIDDFIAVASRLDSTRHLTSHLLPFMVGMEVLSDGDHESDQHQDQGQYQNQDDDTELVSAAFSWMSAVEQKETFSIKKAFSKFKVVKPISTEALVNTALENHHFLLHCFSRFQQAIYRHRIWRFRRRKLLSHSFAHWLDYNRTQVGEPVSDGALVSASFKWITATLGRGKSTSGGSLDLEFRYDYSGQGRLVAATYPPLKHHMDACMCLHLPLAKVPLLLHATAMLDAHLLQKHFRLWRCSIVNTKLSVNLIRRQRIACLLVTTFRKWRTTFVMSGFTYRKEQRQQHDCLLKWRLHSYTRKQAMTLVLYCFEKSVGSAKKRAMLKFEGFARNHSCTRNSFEYAENMKRKRDLKIGLRRWNIKTLYLKHIQHAACHVKRQMLHSNAAVTFGTWLLHAARRIDMKRSANTVVINRFDRLTRESFNFWKNLSDESRAFRAEVDLKRKNRAMTLHNNLVALKTVHMIRILHTSWLVWRAKFRWKTFCKPVDRYIKKLKYFAAFMKWNLICNLSQIANCVQKLWRGYVVRNLTHRSRTRYIRWIMGGKLRTALHFRISTKKRKTFQHWKKYILSSQHSKERYSQRVVQLRNLRVMFRSLTTSRKFRLALERGVTTKKVKDEQHFFSSIKLHMVLARQLLESKIYYRNIKMRGVVTALYLNRLWGVYGRISTGKRLLTNSKIRMNAEKLQPCVVFLKVRYFTKWYNKARVYRVKERKVLVQAMQNKLWKAFMRWNRYCEDSYYYHEQFNHLTPDEFGDVHYNKRMIKKYWRNFRYRLLESKSRNLRNQRMLSISCDHHRVKVLLRFCSHFRDSVSTRRIQIRKVRRRYLRPMFKLWHREFRRNHYYSKRIFTMQVKILRRISQNVFLAWRLYTMKATRLGQLATTIVNQRMFTLKARVLDAWVSAATERILQSKTDVIVERLDDWIKIRAMRKWKYVFDTFQDLNWKSARVIFYYWAKLIKDMKITAKAVKKAEYYHCIRKATERLRDWRYISAVHRNLRMWEFQGRKRLLVWKAKEMLKYWRLKCWWQGRRVLWSRTRVLRRVIDKSMHMSSHRSRTVSFSSSQNNFNATSSVRMTSGDMWRNESRIQTSARTTSFKTPLAHEALQIRALKRWKGHVTGYATYLKTKIFCRWKKLTVKQSAKRAAFVNRLRIMDRRASLLSIFSLLKLNHSKGSASALCRKKSLLRRKRLYFMKWWKCYSVHVNDTRKAHVIREMQKRISSRSVSYKLHLAFKTWRVYCGASFNLNKAHRMFMREVWIAWRLNQRATHHFRCVWLCKFFSAWSGRIDKLVRTRGCLTQMRHVIMMVESRYAISSLDICFD